MPFCIICHICDDLEKLGQGQIDHQIFNFQYLTIKDKICDDLEKLGHGQIDL